MSSSETSNDREKFHKAVMYGLLKEVIELSSKFSNDVTVLSEALVESCYGGKLDLVKWLRVHTAADVNYQHWSGTPSTDNCML